MTDKASANPQARRPPAPLPGLVVAMAIIAAIIGWVAVGSTFLSEASLFAGFMTLWYWAKVEHLAMKRLPASILGALVGIGLAWSIFYGASNYGTAGFMIGLILLALAIYVDVIETLPLFVNAATMIFSIVAAAPLIQLKIDWVELCLATVGGGLFFGAYVAGVTWLAARLSRKNQKRSAVP